MMTGHIANSIKFVFIADTHLWVKKFEHPHQLAGMWYQNQFFAFSGLWSLINANTIRYNDDIFTHLDVF
jgi:hypothetical protein